VNWIDVAVSLFLLAGTASGYKRGFVSFLLGFIAGVAAFVAAAALTPPVVEILDTGLGLTARIAAWLSGRVWGIVGGALVVRVIAYAGVFLVLYLVFRLLTGIVSSLLASPFQEGLLAPVNHLLGATLGFLLGVVNLALIVILVLFLSMAGLIPPQYVQGSVIMSWIKLWLERFVLKGVIM